MAYLLSQEADAMKSDPVEKFGATGAGISMHGSTNNAMYRPS
jgi:hypothetical protein